MRMKHKLGTGVLILTLMPMTAIAQEGEVAEPETVAIEESEPVERDTQESLSTLEGLRDSIDDGDMPESAEFGLSTAIQAVSEGGVDGRVVGDTASAGRSDEATERSTRMNRDAAQRDNAGKGVGGGKAGGNGGKGGGNAGGNGGRGGGNAGGNGNAGGAGR